MVVHIFFFAAVPEHGMAVHMTHGEGLEEFEWNMKKLILCLQLDNRFSLYRASI